MAKFPIDAPKRRVIKALEILGFNMVREKEHISMADENRWIVQVEISKGILQKTSE